MDLDSTLHHFSLFTVQKLQGQKPGFHSDFHRFGRHGFRSACGDFQNRNCTFKALSRSRIGACNARRAVWRTVWVLFEPRFKYLFYSSFHEQAALLKIPVFAVFAAVLGGIGLIQPNLSRRTFSAGHSYGRRNGRFAGRLFFNVGAEGHSQKISDFPIILWACPAPPQCPEAGRALRCNLFHIRFAVAKKDFRCDPSRRLLFDKEFCTEISFIVIFQHISNTILFEARFARPTLFLTLKPEILAVFTNLFFLPLLL